MLSLHGLAIPIVNNNGNTKSDLVEQLLACRNRIEEAIHTVSENSDCCHGRNFQTHPAASVMTNLAIDQHRDRLRRLQEISNEFYALALGVQGQER